MWILSYIFYVLIVDFCFYGKPFRQSLSKQFWTLLRFTKFDLFSVHIERETVHLFCYKSISVSKTKIESKLNASWIVSAWTRTLHAQAQGLIWFDLSDQAGPNMEFNDLRNLIGMELYKKRGHFIKCRGSSDSITRHPPAPTVTTRPLFLPTAFMAFYTHR